MKDNDCQWALLKNLQKNQYERGQTIYDDNGLADKIYMIFKGTVNLRATNGYVFHQYVSLETFGFSELFINSKRNGEAYAHETVKLYFLTKLDLVQIFEDFPDIRKSFTNRSIEHQKVLQAKRMKVVRKQPMFGFSKKLK